MVVAFAALFRGNPGSLLLAVVGPGATASGVWPHLNFAGEETEVSERGGRMGVLSQVTGQLLGTFPVPVLFRQAC